MAGFKYAGNMKAEESARMHLIIANSETVTIGDVVKKSGGFVAVCDANDTPVLGVVEGFVDTNGIDLANAPTANYDGTYTDGSVGTGTYVATSDNQTDKQVQAIVNVDPYALFKNTADQAMTQAMVLQFFSLVDEDQIDGNTNSETVGELQLMYWQPEIGDATTDGYFRLATSALHAYEPEA
jgi:hypothetical protein